MIVDYSDAAFEVLSEHIREDVKRYLVFGKQPSGYLEGVLTNDLRKAILRWPANVDTRLIRSTVQFIHNHFPPASYGSPEAFRKWVETGGMNGLRRRMIKESKTA